MAAKDKGEEPKKKTTKDKDQKPPASKQKASSPPAPTPTAPVVNPEVILPSSTVQPVITGDPYVGVALVCDEGTWNPAPSYVEHFWWRSDNTCVASKTNTYTLQEEDLDSEIWCAVDAVTVEGNRSAPAFSNFVGPIEVAPAPPPPPVPDVPDVGDDVVCIKCGRLWSEHYPGTFDKCPLLPAGTDRQLYDGESVFTPPN